MPLRLLEMATHRTNTQCHAHGARLAIVHGFRGTSKVPWLRCCGFTKLARVKAWHYDEPSFRQ